MSGEQMRCERCGGAIGRLRYTDKGLCHKYAEDCADVFEAELERARPVLAQARRTMFSHGLDVMGECPCLTCATYRDYERAEQAAREGVADGLVREDAVEGAHGGPAVSRDAEDVPSPTGVSGQSSAPSAPSPDLRALRDAFVDGLAEWFRQGRRNCYEHAALLGAVDLVRALNERGTA